MTALTYSEAFKTALEVASHGLRVFPVYSVGPGGRCTCSEADCEHPGKHPKTSHGFKDASVDEEQLHRWNKQCPDANWAVVCGDSFSVVDIDPKHGADPSELIDEHDLTGRPTVWTGEAQTGPLEGVRGGHVYCQNGVPTGKTATRGVEIKAVGGYVMLPGSRHASGVAYEWASELRPWTTSLLPVPAVLVPNAKTKTGPAPPVGSVIAAGDRNSTLTSLAGTMRRRGMSEAAIAAALAVTSRESCDPPLDDRDVRTIARSVGRYEPGEVIGVPPGVGATFPLLTVADLDNLPDPEWLVDGIVPEGNAVVFGQPGTFKSFVTLDLALCVAAGCDWHGHPVKGGNVVYVAAEGIRGMKLRVDAWQQVYGPRDLGRLFFVSEGVDLIDESTAEKLRLTLALVQGPVQLLVVDTMARSMVGADENSAKDVGLFLHELGRLPVATRLLVHHTGKDGVTERGSGALRGAADVMVKVERDGQAHRVALVCDKPPKDGEAWPTMTFEREVVGGSLVMKLVPVFRALLDASDEIRKRIVDFVHKHGPVSQTKIEQGVAGKGVLIRRTLGDLVVEGVLDVTQKGQSKLYTEPRPSPGDGVGRGRSQASPDRTPSPGGCTPQRGAPRGTGSGSLGDNPVPRPRDGDDDRKKSETDCDVCGGLITLVAGRPVCFHCTNERGART
ncbi:MAG: AAA family ATPase [Solirubrobacteraceae bacterium]